MSFLNALSRIGLVELNEQEVQKVEARRAARKQKKASSSTAEDDLDRLLQETQAVLDATDTPAAAPEPAPVSPPDPSATPAMAASDTNVSENRSFEEIYAAAGVQESPFSVEKLLKVLDGLKALPMPSRKAAVLALDAADDAWSIADVILDAQRKGRALREEQRRLATVVAQAEAKASQDIEAADSYLQAASEHIRQQIAELEAALATEVQQVTEQKADIRASLTATREGVARTHARLEDEANRLSQVPVNFGDASLS